MGVVYAAHDVQLERPVAIKMLQPATTDTQARKRFWREARAGARIRHPNVCHLYEIAEHNDELFLVMELPEGVTCATSDPRPTSSTFTAPSDRTVTLIRGMNLELTARFYG